MMRTNVLQKMRFHNTGTRLEIAHNALRAATTPKPKYFIDSVDVFDKYVDVSYISEAALNSGENIDNDWKDGRISITNLKLFIIDNDLQISVYDTPDNEGNHVQIECAVPMGTYLAENMTIAVKAYIEAGKEIEHV